MKITRTSIISGVTRTLDIPVTFNQLQEWEIGGKNIQVVMSNLSPDEREFIMTGITADEWDDTFSDE